MKARFTFILLSSAIIALLILCAWFTMQIFETDIRSGDFSPAARAPAPGQLTITHEEIISVKDKPAATKPSHTNRPLPGTARPDAHHQTAAPDADFVGKVTQLTGTAHRSTPSGISRLNGNDEIFINDHIETGAATRMMITLSDNTTMSFGENASFVIDEYILDRSGRKDSSFSMRMVKGACRIITGQVTKLNPDKFKIETRMATIGIRGCELAISLKPEEEKFFILGLGNNESVEISSSKDGSAIRDILNRKSVPDVETSSVTVKDQSTVVIISKGIGRTIRPISAADLREITTGTSTLRGVRHSPDVKPQSTVFSIKPDDANDGAGTK